MTWIEGHTAAWERQYQKGRYLGEPPEPFVNDIVVAARQAGSADGLYIGCGNGRNLLPLLDQGVPLVGMDVSRTAVAQLVKMRPDYADRVVIGDMNSIPQSTMFDLIVGIQIFMFGTATQAHAHLRAAQSHVRTGGLLALRANAVGTDVWPEHEIYETNADNSFTVTYKAGPKSGLNVHFFSEEELASVFEGWSPVLPIRRDVRTRANGHGQWTQFEAIWRRDR